MNVSAVRHNLLSPRERVVTGLTQFCAGPLRFVGQMLGKAVEWLFAGLALLFSWHPLAKSCVIAIGGFVQGVLEIPGALVASVVGCFGAKSVGAACVQPLLAAVMPLALPLYRALQRFDDTLFPPRALTTREAQVMHALGFPNLHAIRIHEGGLMATLCLRHARAQTQDNHIYARDLTDAVLAHELVHTLQYDDAGGMAPFLTRYAANYVATGFNYWEIPEEREAYAMVDQCLAEPQSSLANSFPLPPKA